MTGENPTVARDLEARIGAEIRRQRKRRDMTVASLADAAGLSQGMLSEIETGQTSASLAPCPAPGRGPDGAALGALRCHRAKQRRLIRAGRRGDPN